MIAERLSISPVRVIQSDTLVERSLELVKKSIIFGWKREFYLAAALFNLKMFSPDFRSYCKELHLSDTSIKRFVRVGKRLHQIVNSEEQGVSFVSETDLEWITERFIRSGEKITLRGLDKASRDLGSFRSYLKGEIHEVDILGGTVSIKELPPSTDVSDSKENIPSVSSVSTSQIPSPSIWDELENVILQLPQTLRSIVERASTDTSMNVDQIFAKYRAISTALERVRSSVSAIHRGDNNEAVEMLVSNDFELL